MDTKEMIKNFETFSDEQIKKKIQQHIRRIEQLLALENKTKAKKLYEELKLMAKVVKDRNRKSEVLTSKFQEEVLDENSIEAKMAKYYEKFGDMEELRNSFKSEDRKPKAENKIAPKKFNFDLGDEEEEEEEPERQEREEQKSEQQEQQKPKISRKILPMDIEDSEAPTEEDLKAVKEEGFSLSILKSLSGQGSLAEKDLGFKTFKKKK